MSLVDAATSKTQNAITGFNSNLIGSTAASVFGAATIVVKPKRSIGGFAAQVTLEESHDDELVITDHPLEKGTQISDHAYKRPRSVTIRCGWSDSPSSGGGVAGLIDSVQSLVTGSNINQVRDTYAKLLALQESFVPFDVITGKRTYTNMLFQSLRVTTDVRSENSLQVTAVLREVIIVSTKPLASNAPAANQLDPGKTNPLSLNGLKSLVATTLTTALTNKALSLIPPLPSLPKLPFGIS